MTTAGRDLYDDPRFFEGYRRLRDSGAGINDAIEIPAMSRMLPPVAGAAVLDLGCGAGGLARRLADAGAAHVLAVDSSQRMLALATPHPRVRYLRADLDELTLPAGCADLVASSLALHYVADYSGLVRRVAQWLRPGGRFVFSIEHPICTAADPMTGWRTIDDGTLWPVDDYASEGPRTQNWIIEGAQKHHRRMATLIGGLLVLAARQNRAAKHPSRNVSDHRELTRKPANLVTLGEIMDPVSGGEGDDADQRADDPAPPYGHRAQTHP